MASSPYLTPELKQYLKENKVEETLNSLVNQLLKGKYSDPYAFMIKSLEEKCSSEITLISIKAFETFNCEVSPMISLIFTCSYKLKPIEITISGGTGGQILDATNNLVDIENNERFQGKGLKKACDLINKVLNEKLKNCIVQNQKKADEALQVFFEEKEKTVANIANAISFSLPNICAKLYNVPLYQYLRTSADCYKKTTNKPPCLIINLLQGSKLVGSKCKFMKFQIILESEKTAIEKFLMIQKIVNHIKKTIVSGKGGESALKFYQDGSLICPYDTVQDNMKLIEEAINVNGCKEDVRIGVVVHADNFYLPEQKKYELDNPKKPEDTDQLIEYLFKLCNDRPLIAYLEDPVAEDDVEGWRKILIKFKDSKVELGTRKLYSNLSKSKQLTPEEENQNKLFPSRSFYKMSDFLTLTELFSLHKQLMASQKIKWMILCENNVENSDSSIVDLAVNINLNKKSIFFKFGLENVALCLNPPLKLERVVKYNRFIEISEQEIAKN